MRSSDPALTRVLRTPPPARRVAELGSLDVMMAAMRIAACLRPLVDSLVERARDALCHQRHFYPLAAVVAADGRLWGVDTDDGSYELPAPESAVDTLVKRFQADAASGLITAAATCVDTAIFPSLRGEPHCIRVLAEHASGESVQVDVPYLSRWWRRPTFQSPRVLVAPPRVFAPSSGRPSN